MVIDKQTLAWINKSHYWMKLLKPKYKKNIGGGLAENASLPDTLYASVNYFYNYITERKEAIMGNHWGFEKWHHSPQLENNKCECPRCNLKGEKWFQMPMEYYNE